MQMRLMPSRLLEEEIILQSEPRTFQEMKGRQQEVKVRRSADDVLAGINK